MRNISYIRKSPIALFLVVLSVAVMLLSGVRITPERANAAITTCGTVYNLTVSGGPVSGAPTGTYGNVAYIMVETPLSAATSFREMIIKLKASDGTVIGMIGEAAQSTVTTTSWMMPWATGLRPNGQYLVSVDAVHTDNSICTIGDLTMYIMNTNTATISTVAQPSSWRGLPGSKPDFTLSTHVIQPPQVDMDVTPYAMYVWNASSSIGTVAQANHTHVATLTTGQTTGNGNIHAEVFYGTGSSHFVDIPITVEATTAPLTNTTTPPSTSGGGSNATSTATTAQPSSGGSGSTAAVAATSETALQDNPTAQTCIVSVLGETRYTDINSGTVRPNSAETDKYRVCFASSNYVLPTNFAPVAPTAVKKLDEGKAVTISELKNVTTESADGKKLGLRLQGKASPNSMVFVYIYSDPLVLTTKADAEGNWEYTLQNPIEPGKHEVYTVVDRGDGTYERSRPLSFLIGTATAAEANPNGLSLQLADASTPSESNHGLVLYVAATTIAIIAFLLVLLFLVRKHDAAQVVKNEMLNTNGIPVQQDVPPVVSDGQDTNRDDETQQGL